MPDKYKIHNPFQRLSIIAYMSEEKLVDTAIRGAGVFWTSIHFIGLIMKQSRGDENSISKYFSQQNEFNNVSVGVRETWWLVHSVFYFLLTMEQKVWQQPARSNWNYFIFLLLRRTSHFANEQNNGNCGKICRPIMNHDGCDMWQK